MHRLHDALRLLLHVAREVGVDYILAFHGRLQRRGVKDIAFDDRHAAGIGVFQSVGPAKVERQLRVRIP